MDDKLLEYKVDEHDNKIKEHDSRLNEHEHKIEDIVVSNQRLADSIDTLAKNMRDGFGVLRWLIGLFISGLVGMFFFIIQSLI